MPPQDIAGHRMVADAVSVNIATGESLTLVEEFDRYIDERALDIVQPDAAQIGLTQLVDVARRAEPAGILGRPAFAVVRAVRRGALAGLPDGSQQRADRVPGDGLVRGGLHNGGRDGVLPVGTRRASAGPRSTACCARSTVPGWVSEAFARTHSHRIARGEVIGAGTWAGGEPATEGPRKPRRHCRAVTRSGGGRFGADPVPCGDPPPIRHAAQRGSNCCRFAATPCAARSPALPSPPSR